MAGLIDASFQRIQFTPDLLPADITGGEIFHADSARFEFLPGPIFHSIVLADEINRAPAKVQAALLEGMAERQVTAGGQTHELPALFFVMATRNPIEQEGTYLLPEAQLDRFLMQTDIDYPDINIEREILLLGRAEEQAAPVLAPILSVAQIFSARRQIADQHMSEAVQNYLLALIVASRDTTPYGSALDREIEHGASPRATMALDRCSRARAWLQGRDYVTPDDVQALAHDCLRHRVVPAMAAQARGVSSDAIIDDLLNLVPVT
jgi:MoxR-like ATPase